jgi:hypothetical protein
MAGLAFAVALLGTAAPASALLGDFRLVTGTLTLWPGDLDGFRVALVQGDDADRYFVRVTPGTVVSAGVAPGAAVAIVGQEGPVSTELTAVSIQPRAALDAGRQMGPWRMLSGVIQSVTGTIAVLGTSAGLFTVDLSGLGPSAVTIAPGRHVTVVGLVPAPGRLAARGIAGDVTPGR